MHPVQTPSPVRNGIAVASVSLGFFSMLVFWWYPFGLILGSAGLVLGLVCLATKIRGGRFGENYALLGTILCSISVSTILILTQGLGYVMWNH